MDAEAFLAAQLWLRRLPTETWPLADGNSQGSGRIVILAQAKCCFLLEDRPSAAPPPRITRSSSDNTDTRGSRSDSPRSRQRQRPRPLRFSTRSAAASAVETNARSTEGYPGPSDTRSPETSNNRGDNPGEAENGRGNIYGGCSSRFQLDNSGTVRARGEEEGQRARGRSTATAEAKDVDAVPVPVPVPVPVTVTVPLKREFDFGLAISRRDGPREEGRIGDGRPPAGEGGGTLLLRIGGKVFQAEHTLIRSIAYPRGGGGSRGAGSNAGGDRSARKGRSDEGADVNRGCGSGADGRGKPPPPARGIGLPPLRPPPTVPAAPGAPGTAGTAATGTKRTLDASTAGGGAGGIADTGRGEGGYGNGRRPEGVGKRGRFEAGGGIAGTAGSCDERATGATAPQARRSEDGEDGVEEGMPFCGLLFPGVLLKFWLPQQGNTPAGTRAEAVARMQAVVSNMLAGLSPNPRYEYPRGGGGGIAVPGLDGEIRSVVAEAKENGFRLRCEAWDEFVYGSHVLLRQQRASALRRRGGGGDAGGPVVSRTCARCSDSMGVDSPVLSGLSARGFENSGLGDESPSDVGRARALTCLAECFSQASLPSSAKLSAQRLLQDAATSAGRELEDALERAFPLDLSQGTTDTSTRVSVASELEASLHRVQAARQAALTLTLLPASEMLDESGGSA